MGRRRLQYSARYRVGGSPAEQERCSRCLIKLLSDLASPASPAHQPTSFSMAAPDATANDPLTIGGQRAATTQE